MSSITFLASSRPFTIPDEIQEYYNKTTLEKGHQHISLWVRELDSLGWEEFAEDLFSMTYIYEIIGADSSLFLIYLEKYMEIGDVLELLYIPNQNDYKYYKRELVEAPEPIYINVRSLTYQDGNGTYKLDPKKWVEELSHRNFITEFGVTTIEKY
ncbi:hypothetical protein [Sutcliffiella horikoshii]|uniref:hypothetical protein n=1 Tax=Sutcliffiella horikoshii TaxID=79883 RepID=UPI001F17566D|nr:hypothetical protein [Sutcliffiella horikoshii]MCG1023756.1 hypothetical protein [Sutcliffiella horikoshii]